MLIFDYVYCAVTLLPFDCIFAGTTCEANINECHSSPCLHNASCSDLIGGFECTCLPGFTGESYS